MKTDASKPAVKTAFPKLVIYKDGMVLLLKSKQEGFVVHPGRSKFAVAYYSDLWSEEREDYRGTIKLWN